MSDPTFGPYVRFSAGIVAGVGASLVTQPFDVIKTKMQLYPDKFTSVRHVVPYVFQVCVKQEVNNLFSFAYFRFQNLTRF